MRQRLGRLPSPVLDRNDGNPHLHAKLRVIRDPAPARPELRVARMNNRRQALSILRTAGLQALFQGIGRPCGVSVTDIEYPVHLG